MEAPPTPSPGKAAKPKFFYGWVIVGVMILIGLVQTGQFNPTIGVFIKPITEQYGWTRTQFTIAVSLGTLLASVASIGIGPLLDKYGPKWSVVVGLLVIAGSSIGMAFIHSLWQLFICIIAGRIAVQGAINLALTVTVPKWFVRTRGRAVAISGLGNRLGNGFTPVYTQSLVSEFGWRTATIGLGILTLGLALIPSFLFLKRQPEDIGLRPDGDSAEGGPEPKRKAGAKPKKARASYATEVNFTLKEAVRTKAFYLMTTVIVLMMLVAPGLNLHLIPYLTDQGLSPRYAALLVTIFSLAGGIGGLGIGWFVERFSLRYTFAFCFVAFAASILILMQVQSITVGLIWALFNGIIFGSMITLLYLMIPEYFGRNSLGAIRGVTTPLQLGANALSPLMAAIVYDHTGSYHIIFWVFIAFYITAALILLITTPPRPPVRIPAAMA